MVDTVATTDLAHDAPVSSDAATPEVARAFAPFVETAADGTRRLDLLVEGVRCGACVQRIESALRREADVVQARVNLTSRRLTLAWRGAAARADHFAETIAALGFRPVPFRPQRLEARDRRAEGELLRAMAVAGFAAGNVMLLSVSLWAGYFEGMGPATRDLLHWFSALIALPAIAYAGRPFYRSALAALAAGRTNMDVPISLGVLLAAGMSLFETIEGGRHVYFDSAIALLFFLLVGRYLDHRARARARVAVGRLRALAVGAVSVLREDGTAEAMPPERLSPGLVVLTAAGERIAADGRVEAGRSEVDTSLITGESLPRAAGPGDRVFAGTLNLGAPLRIRVSGVGEGTLLAEIVRLMEQAEQRRDRYVALADRVSRFYAPAVHGLALATFLGWTFVMGAPWQAALLNAVAVLIVTCPCALGLAVPVVQVIASGRLMRGGVLLKSATALERFADVDTVVFDKTGTLTLGRPTLRADTVDAEALRLGASLAAASRHPLARALRRAAPDAPVAEGVREVPGRGLALATDAGEVRLGSRAWCGIAGEGAVGAASVPGPELWLSRPERAPVRFAFEDAARPDAAEVLRALDARGFAVELLSGDRPGAAGALAEALGIETWRASLDPAQKVAHLERLAAQGRRVLMVGDGLNDAPALAAARVSLSPSSAADISQTAADAVFQGERLGPVLDVLGVARRARRLVQQNFALAFAYNVVTVPLAVAGLVTPLLAALAMSASSLVVIANALRLNLPRRREGRL